MREGKPEADKIILTSQYPDEFKKGTLGANLEQITQGLKTALQLDAQVVVCIGEAAFTYREEIRRIIELPEGRS